MEPSQTEDSVQIGPDKIQFIGETVVIFAAYEMDWPLREFCRVPIFFRNRKYYLRGKSKPEPPYAVRYELWPWPDQFHEAAHREIIYDEDYVLERDAGAGSEKKNAFIRMLWLPFYPFLGFFWSGFKERVLSRYGFVPTSITGISIALAFNLCICQGIFAGWLHSGLLSLIFGTPLWLDFVALFVLISDCVMRYDQRLKGETEATYGFLEWIPGF